MSVFWDIQHQRMAWSLKPGWRVFQGHWKWRHSTDFLLVHHCKYGSILYRFRVIWRWIIPWPWNLGYRPLKIIKLVPFESLGEVSYLPSIVTMALSCIYSEIKRDINGKSWFFHTPLHSTPPLGGPHQSIVTPFGGATRRLKKFEDISNCLDTIPAWESMHNLNSQETWGNFTKLTYNDSISD